MKFGLLLLIIYVVSADAATVLVSKSFFVLIKRKKFKKLNKLLFQLKSHIDYGFPGPRKQRQASADDYYRRPQYEGIVDQPYDQGAPASRSSGYTPSNVPQQGYSGQAYGSQPSSYPSSYRPRAPPKQTVTTVKFLS